MWTCVHCALSVMFQAVEADVDEFGFFFLCPGCGGRNKLVNIGVGEAALIQEV